MLWNEFKGDQRIALMMKWGRGHELIGVYILYSPINLGHVTTMCVCVTLCECVHVFVCSHLATKVFIGKLATGYGMSVGDHRVA